MVSRRELSPDDVLTIDDLDGWHRDGTWLAVLGHPIKHSVSPAMHNAALAEMAAAESRFHTWKYVRFDVPPDALPEALAALHRHGFQGLNLTVPHKVIAFDRIHQVDPAARPIGAVNTLRATPEGWEGFNTDGYGLATGMRETLGAELTGADVILLGAGGAARGAAVECVQRGCRSLWIANRTRANLDELLRVLAPLTAPHGTHVAGFAPSDPPNDLPAGAWVINATSAGLKADDPLPVELTRLPTPAGVYDMIYNPRETALLKQARELGLKTANGLGMLIHQGARALEIWTGGKVPVNTMRLAAERAMAR